LLQITFVTLGLGCGMKELLALLESYPSLIVVYLPTFRHSLWSHHRL